MSVDIALGVPTAGEGSELPYRRVMGVFQDDRLERLPVHVAGPPAYRRLRRRQRQTRLPMRHAREVSFPADAGQLHDFAAVVLDDEHTLLDRDLRRGRERARIRSPPNRPPDR